MARVLVIEDNGDVRLAIRMGLEAAGHQVDDVGDGEEGVRMYAKAPYDAVISDINMPNKDGIQSLLELKTDYPDLKLIAISGEKDLYLETAEEFGAVRTLAKPFAPRQLVEMLEEVLAEK